MNQQPLKRRNPFANPLANMGNEEKTTTVEQEPVVETPVVEQKRVETPIYEEQPVQQPVYQPQYQPQYQQTQPISQPRTQQRQQNRVVGRQTQQYYNYKQETERDKFTSTMERSLRRSIKVVCAQRGIMFAQFVEEACRDKLEREGFK